MNMPGFTAEASLCGPGKNYNAAPVWSADDGGRVSPALVGRWSLFGCELNCIEVCTRFCNPTGWDCCKWETRCAVDWSCLNRLRNIFGF